MKSLKFAAIATLFAAGSAFASGSANLAVSASVSGTCKLFASASGAMLATGADIGMDFGAIDPLGTSDVTKTATVYYKCTKGTSGFSFKVNSDATGSIASTLTHGGGGPALPITIGWTPPAAPFTGFSVDAQSVVLTGTILKTDFSVAEAGGYSKDIPISIDP